ncbi:hypothetical protein C8Q80DRAFT_1269114 [Daedaleopsis nitida]|nr:hypothetical protein C8Q80DRAFT_1269114 [Daedaleopsis nitida]
MSANPSGSLHFTNSAPFHCDADTGSDGSSLNVNSDIALCNTHPGQRHFSCFALFPSGGCHLRSSECALVLSLINVLVSFALAFGFVFIGSAIHANPALGAQQPIHHDRAQVVAYSCVVVDSVALLLIAALVSWAVDSR